MSPPSFLLPLPNSVWLLHCIPINPILWRIKRFLLIRKAIYATIKMPLVRTNGVSMIVDRARTQDNQRPWPKNTILTGPSPIHKGRYKCRKGWPRPPAFGRRRYDVAQKWEKTLILNVMGKWRPRIHMWICFVAYLVKLLSKNKVWKFELDKKGKTKNSQS